MARSARRLAPALCALALMVATSCAVVGQGSSDHPRMGTVTISSAPDYRLGGTVSAAYDASGVLHLGVRAEGDTTTVGVTGSGSNLVWEVALGTCSEWFDGRQRQVYFRSLEPIDPPGHQAFEASIAPVPRFQDLVLLAIENGSPSDVVGCADLGVPQELAS